MGLLLDIFYAAALTAFLSFGFFLALKYARVFLMSYGEVVILGAYISTFYQAGVWGWALAATVAACAGALVGGLHYVLLRGVFERGRTIESLLLTWGGALVMMELFRLGFGPSGRFAPSFFSEVWLIGDAPFPHARVMNLVLVLVACVLLFVSVSALNRRQRLAALAYGHRVAVEYGVPAPPLLFAVMVLACATAGISGVIIGQESAITPYGGLQYTILAALAALVAGPRVLSGVVVAASLAGARTWLGYEFGLTPAWLVVLLLVVVAASLRRGGGAAYG